MLPELIRKITEHTQNGMTREADVVYLFVCIRKMLEQETGAQDFADLRFYCNWALHAKLEGSKAQNIIALFETQLECLKDKNQECNDVRIENLCTLRTLQRELRTFFKKYHIPVRWLDSPDAFAHFLSLFTAIIHACPLVIKPTNRASLIKQIDVTLEWANETYKGYTHYRIDWTIDLKDGEETGISVFNSFKPSRSL